MSNRVSGVVRWYNQVKGYGYIDGDDGREVLVHRAAVEDFPFLTEGLRVTYLMVTDEGDDSGEVHAEQVHVVQ
ncbi:cold shock domain-containing protein [Kitasatospora sp. GAS204B]|uniref:cold shock domain-containing protein n=1 Tax=unclassified Kitasatospora TaxID=2633591 RepID=UPI0024738062|nr:cold shock domain-containing protein [Kitasatospora sp. GAS204B]MDH6120454.1 CspA family cold shock protein [Kitasatospora sp. GAS204B]